MKIDTGSITPDERGAVNRENRFINKNSHTTRLNEKSAAHLVNARSAPSDWHSTFFLDWIFFPLECEKTSGRGGVKHGGGEVLFFDRRRRRFLVLQMGKNTSRFSYDARSYTTPSPLCIKGSRVFFRAYRA